MRAAKFTESRFIPVNSEMLVAVRYDEEAQHLDVIFRTGEKYRYLRVPRAEYEGLMNAQSHGQYMHANILGGRYDHDRL
jgi:hypothetical protein